MKTKLFKSLSLILVTMFIILPFAFSAHAKSDKPHLRADTEAIEYIEKYANDISNNDEQYSVDNYQYIESFTQHKSYLLYTLSPFGYAIYDEVSGIVEEMILDSEDPYKNAENGTRYYGGPMNHIVRTDDEYFLLSNDVKLTDEDIEQLIKLETYTVTNRQNMPKGIPQITNNYYMTSAPYFHTSLGDHFAYNISGTCTHIACAIMLGYYDNYINTQFVPTAYECGYGTTEDFHILLQSFLGSGPSGVINAANGLNSYFSSIFFTSPSAYYDTGSHATVYSRVGNRVLNNLPTVIAMFSSYNEDCPMNHSVVAYGYRVESVGVEMKSAAYYVHTGWHGPYTGVYAWDWFADDLYIA